MPVWSFEQVAAIAPSSRALATAEGLAEPRCWRSTGSDERVVWGSCLGGGAEPYEVWVDHVAVAWRCSCPSRQRPCKHVVALLLRWSRGEVVAATAPAAIASWAARHRLDDRGVGDAVGALDPVDETTVGAPGDGQPDEPDATTGAPTDRGDLDRARDERVARMREGLVELDRWLADRLRTGLSDPALAQYRTWDELASRLVDARAGALANRVRRLAGLVGASPDWHDRVLAEIGVLHLLASAGLRMGELPGPLADAVATASGWQVRQADVLEAAPDHDVWFVAGRSDTREDRIEVRRWWLRGVESDEWAMLLSFAAYQQTLDDSLRVGQLVEADLHRYPGRSLRAIVGERTGDPLPIGVDASVFGTVAAACDAIGRRVAAEPWIERVPALVRAAPALLDGRWVLGDQTGSLPLVAADRALATLLAASVGTAVDLAVEWTPVGMVPLAVHLADRSIDLGPVADPSFVAA